MKSSNDQRAEAWDRLKSFKGIIPDEIDTKAELSEARDEKYLGFDYTEWSQNLWEDLTIDEIFIKATEAEKKQSLPEKITHIK